ncbi:MAG: hypothetical protein KDD99_28025, partial [Bacteroidetes bacterium]|nr:hypothetical protein [Bacteroidota bacterium]
MVNNSGLIIEKYDRNGKKVLEVPLPKKDGWTSMQSGTDHSVLIAELEELYVLDKGEKVLKSHPINALVPDDEKKLHILDFIQKKNKDIWLVGEDRRFSHYEARTNRLFNFRENLKDVIPNSIVLRRIFQDNAGVIWLGTHLGVIKVNPQKTLFETYLSGKEEICSGYCSFRGITEDESGHIYASFYNSIFKINPESGTTSFPFPEVQFTPFGLEYQDGTLILNNGNGLDLTTGLMEDVFMDTKMAMDLGIFARDNLGRLWWGWGGELHFLHKHEGKSFWQKVPEVNLTNPIVDIKYDTFGHKLWLGTAFALFSYETDTWEYEVYDESVLGENISVRYLHPDGKGNLWIGTDYGLVFFDPATGKLKKYTDKDGVSNNYVATILPEGDSCLWLGTNLGLSRFSIQSEYFLNFFEEDGLAHNEFNRRSAYKAKSGQFFFGGIRGITAFYPKEVMAQYEASQQSGKVVLASFSKTSHQKDSSITNLFAGDEPKIEVFYHDKSFELDYVLTDYRNPEKILYSYQLEGFEDTWSRPSKRNSVTFHSLPAGKYTFKVKARDARGGWNPNMLAVKITVYPPWWETWWAYTLYALIGLGLLVGIYYFLARRLQLKAQLEIEKANAIRLKELDIFKSRLFTNLTHEFRTPLTVILGMSDKVEKEPDTYLNDGLKLIRRNGKNMLQLINQLLDLSKLETNSFKLKPINGDIVPFARYVTASFQS